MESEASIQTGNETWNIILSRTEVHHGLKLKLQNHDESIQSFTYALFPTMKKPSPVDWCCFTKENKGVKNIRCHQLKQGDELAERLEAYRRNYAKAVVIINTEDNYHLTDGSYSRIEFTLPVCIVKSSDGKKILSFMESNELKNVLAQVNADTTSTEPTNKITFRPLRRRLMAKDYLNEIKKCMIDSNMAPLVVTKDAEKIKFLMSAFHYYEETIRKENSNEIDEISSLLIDHMNKLFKQDFIFHLLLTYRIHKKNHKYYNEEYVTAYIAKVERCLSPQSFRDLISFTEQDDFKVIFGEEDKHSSVFLLLKQACLELMGISYKDQIVKMSKKPTICNGSMGTPVYKHFISSRMIWVSMALKFSVAHGEPLSQNMWGKKILFRDGIILNSATIQDLKNGIEVGKCLELPKDLSCNARDLLSLITKKLRPFSHIMCFLLSLEEYLPFEEVNPVLTKIREIYCDFLHQPVQDKLILGVEGTLLGCLTEGISFLDVVYHLLMDKISLDDVELEIGHWLKALLSLVDITGENSVHYLNYFVKGTEEVNIKYLHIIQKHIIDVTKEALPSLNIHQFSTLYKSFLFWPDTFCQDYLKIYHIPEDVKLSDPSWKVLFSAVVKQCGSAHQHYFLSEFLQEIGKKYQDKDRQADFIISLFKFEVEKLLPQSDQNKDRASYEVRSKFVTFLHRYIKEHALEYILIEKMTVIFDSISNKNDGFQMLILKVLCKRVIPELVAVSETRKGRTQLDKKFFEILQNSTKPLKSDLSWLTSVSPKQYFCWSIVASFCSKLKISTENFNWYDCYSSCIKELCSVFADYCKRKKLKEEKCIIIDKLPDDLHSHPSEDIKRYFKWVAEIQFFFQHWNCKLDSKDISYAELVLYSKSEISLNRLKNIVVASSLMTIPTVITIRDIFLADYEALNMLLLRYIPGQPDYKWCNLPALFEDYRVCLPQDVQDTIINKMQFPFQDGQATSENEKEKNPIPLQKNKFQPGHDISIKLHRSMTLRELSYVVEKVSHFQKPFEDYLEELVFFKLKRSVLYDKFLRFYLKKISQTQLLPRDDNYFGDFSLSTAPYLPHFISSPSPQGLPDLTQALKDTHDLIHKILLGKATYSDICADDELLLHLPDREREFAILYDYIQIARLPDDNDCKGLEEVESMLELFQYTSYFKNIRVVCEQYHLGKCIQDVMFQELSKIMQIISSEEDRSKITPPEASEMMKRVKEILCFGKKTSSKCLNIFSTLTKSAAFYQFIKDKQFHIGERQGIFMQQYELITAQLQHEDYNERVLNHLRAAFKVIIPFMDTEKDFTSLMKEVTALHAANSMKHFETVNGNINLIKRWFTRAEGNTLENVAKELDCVLNTGYFKFQFGGEESDNLDKLLLEYRPSSAHRLSTVSQTDGPELTLLEQQATSQEDQPIECWNMEQVRDFVRKLGFMDKEEKGGDKIKLFLHLSQTMYKVFELYQRLQEMGYDYSHSKSTITDPFQCSNSKEEVDKLMYNTQILVENWRQEVSDLRSRYNWLYYFCMPKLLQLYQLICSSIEPVEKVKQIVHEVSFLVANHVTDLNKLREEVERVLEEFASQISDTSNSPMLMVGKFLDMLLKDHNPPRRPSIRIGPTHHYIIAQPLYFCPAYSQMDFLSLILRIFSGVPEAYQVLHCKATTTEEELSLFLKRASHNCTHYLMLNVNMLPFKLQEQMAQQHLITQKEQHQDDDVPSSVIHYVESSPSILREMPWIQLKEIKRMSLCETLNGGAKDTFVKDDFACVELVYGYAGDGKTHYIKKNLSSCSEHRIIAVNEAFSPLYAISKLRSLPLYQRNIGLFFNFTLLPPGDRVTESERKHYNHLLEVIGWFFFDLLLLRYVEDTKTGLSFRLPRGLGWSIYIEVPSQDRKTSAEESLKHFTDAIPALHLLGSPRHISPDIPYTMDSDVQLVCKYLRAYNRGEEGIDRLYLEPPEKYKHKLPKPKPNKFSADPDLSDEECKDLLHQHMPEHIASSKVTQQLFIRYMKRRCELLDSIHYFTLNSGIGEYRKDDFGLQFTTNTKKLGSTMMGTMLKEVSEYCDPCVKDLRPHQQLIYDFKDGGSSFGLLSLQPDKLDPNDRMKFEKLGFDIPSIVDLCQRELLDKYLSRALNLKLGKNDRLTDIDESKYVLTLDYTVKMLDIHERYMCGVPVIIEGETGVGKTALIEMLSKLWNQSLVMEWKKVHERILENIQKEFEEIPKNVMSEDYEACVQAIEAINSGNVTKESLVHLYNYIHCKDEKIFKKLRCHLTLLRNDWIIPLLTFREYLVNCFDELFEQAERDNSPEAISCLLYAILKAEIKTTFHKINVHAAMTPADIKALFKPIFKQAEYLKRAHLQIVQRLKDGKQHSEASVDIDCNSLRAPFVTIFLDEINTSSCLGLFKEIIVDKSFNGEDIQENIFIVAACNPRRGNSLASHHTETWVRTTYYVRSLHPTLKLLMWNYDALNANQEREYVNAKMKLLYKDMTNPEVACLAELIVTSQNKMREFVFRQLTKDHQEEAEVSSRSCVSQRDIQRVFTFFQWFKQMYDKYAPHGRREDYHQRAILVSLGMVYYMRLNLEFRNEYREALEKIKGIHEISFSTAFNEELDYYIKQMELPKGIAHTLALKENIFATIVCTLTRTPLIIVGAPGSSKTLSFKQTIANLMGQVSKKELFRDTEIFSSLDAHYYQCSRHTTSKEIDTVFSRAINRQKSHDDFALHIYCVVFMDEAGLPEESHESLKVLHYHLDKRDVSFVAITNHVLDAAKTNRAVSLFRPETSDKDLETLAKGCLCFNPEKPPPERDMNMVVEFCKSYSHFMKKPAFSRFFGLRDFIHFVNYLRRKRDEGCIFSPFLVLQALERNFNGSSEFEDICQFFLRVFRDSGTSMDVIKKQRGIVEVLRDSMSDIPQAEQVLTENEIRYKLIIDPSEDDSLVRQLFSMRVLNREKTRIYMCSNFPGDGEVQKINTIAAIRHSAIKGYTVVMSQTDDIHESFYDLFNQRFRRIDDPDHDHCARYYTNIAIGAYLKPSRVHPNFQCVVVIKKSELDVTPAPFLNRFEKYLVSYSSLLETVLKSIPCAPCVSIVIQTAKEKVNDFIRCVSGSESLYGLLEKDTLDSLILNFLPPIDFTYKKLEKVEKVGENSQNVRAYLFQEILNVLRNNAGFHIPQCSNIGELEMDTEHVWNILAHDAKPQTMTHQDALDATVEAFNTLYRAHGPSSNPQEQFNLTPGACMVVSLLQQILVRLFTKRLMQLMTTEAIILNRNKIPSTYLENYLSNQAHFSLKKAITNCHKALITDSSRAANKLLCFTRSSPLIHALPGQFPNIITKRGDETIVKTVKKLVYEEVDKLMVYKLSTLHSQNLVQDILQDFILSDTAEVFVLLANMQETSKKIINHIRVMIEEAELESRHQVKVFVLLVHFPPAQFFQQCYPTLFLKGWDHCYLDTIGQNDINEEVDVQDWFLKCCGPFQCSSDEPDALLRALNQLLPQAVSVLSARLYFGNKDDNSFNSNMNATQRSKALTKLLHDHGLGVLLCEKFYAYWKPKVMIEYLERAASFSKQRESTLNITDSIHTEFKALFFDFCVVLLTQANQNFNLDILYAEDCPLHYQQFFLNIFKTSLTPKLDELNLQSNNLPKLQSPVHCPHFPFFGDIFNLIEESVEFCSEIASVQVDVLADSSVGESLDAHASRVPKDAEARLKSLTAAVISSLEPQINKPQKQVLDVVISGMSSHPDLWDCYFKDFMIHKLKLKDHGSDDIAHRLVYAYFEQLHKHKPLYRLVEIHCYIAVHQLELAKMATTLRPLSEVQMLSQGSCVLLPAYIHTFDTEDLLKSVRRHNHLLGSPACLSCFVITTLFNAIISVFFPRISNQPMFDVLRVWFKSYLDIMALPTFKKYIYASFSQQLTAEAGMIETNLEAILNVMQATFLVLQCTQSNLTLDKDAGTRIFPTLISRYFTKGDKNLILKSRPSLSEVTDLTVGMLSSSPRVLVEGLLSHYFSSERFSYHHEDVIWFLQLTNNQRTFETRCPSPNPLEINLNLFKHHLSCILCNHHDSDQEPDLLQLHRCKNIRKLVGDVIMSDGFLGPPGVYVPVFYQSCSFTGELHLNERMQQPLCHLYFLTIMENLRSNNRSSEKSNRLGCLVHFTTSIQDQLKNAEGGEAVLLWLELAAVIQVLIWQFSMQLDPTQPQRLREVQVLFDNVNRLEDKHSYCRLLTGDLFNGLERILDDPTMGESGSEGHGIVLTMHLMQILNSSRKLTALMTSSSNSLHNINCLNHIRQRFQTLANQHSPQKYHFPSFLQRRAEFSNLYMQVSLVMMMIHNGSRRLTDLIYCLNRFGVTTADKLLSSRMIIWLVTYYEFYDKNVSSPLLSEIMGGSEMLPFLKDECCVRFIQCFLNPDLMIKEEEDINSLAEQQVSDHAQIDSLYELFTPGDIGQSDRDLRHSLANMAAVVLGNLSRSNHLWFHLFAPDQLQKTYMTGFMYDKIINGKDMFYDYGVELSPEGMLGRQDYVTHACRGTYTLHSLYLLLWANFGAFCMALLTQPQAKHGIHGPIISESLPVRHYCVTHVRSLWSHIKNSLGLSEEQRSFFVMKCMNEFYKLSKSCYTSSITQERFICIENCNVICDTLDELNTYEKMWHTCIYKPAWKKLAEEFKISADTRETLFSEIWKLKEHYPHFPTEHEFTHSIMVTGDLQQYSEEGDGWLLTKFAMKFAQLQEGDLLLSDVVELYQWIHTNLSHIVTRDQSSSITIGHVIEKVKRNSTKESGEYLWKLYERVKLNYNRYVDLVNGRHRTCTTQFGNEMCRIKDDTPLLHFLTLPSSTAQPEEIHGCLYIVIMDVITNHNHIIESLYSMLQKDRHASLAYFVPKEPSKIELAEVNRSDSIISCNTKLHGVRTYLQLIQSRHSPELHQQLPSFQFKQLEEDVVTTFISGKPLIDDDLSEFKIAFKFKEYQEQTISLGTVFTSRDLQDMADKLPENFKHILPDDLLKDLEYKFHSASYHLMVEVVTALRIIIGHLVKALEDGRAQHHVNLASETVQDFILRLYDDPSERDTITLHKIGVQSASPTHMACLESLCLTSTYSCLKLFYSWVVDGYYDFNTLPFMLKSHLNEDDRLFIVEESSPLSSSDFDPQKETQRLINILKHSEHGIASRVDDTSDMPILDYLIKCNKLQEDDILIHCIPKTVMLRHYVALRLSLRRQLLNLKQEPEGSVEDKKCKDIWSDFVSDLWKERLPHLLEELYGEEVRLSFSSVADHYGFQEKYKMEEGDKDLEIAFTKQLRWDITGFDNEQSFNDKVQEENSSVPESLSILKEYDEVKAGTYSVDDVAKFLDKIGLQQYIETFKSQDIDGSMLLESDAEALLDFGVKSPPNQKKIMELFQRELHGSVTKYTTGHLSDFLKEIGLDKYSQTLEDHKIDGYMILKTDKTLLKSVLREIGVSSGDIIKLLTKYRKKCEQ